MIPYAQILGKVAVKIDDVVGEAEDKLQEVNDKLFEINTIDFCQPMGYIMGKALPPNSPANKAVGKFADKLRKFVDKIGSVDLKEKALNKIDDTAGTTEAQRQKRQETIDALLEIKREIDDLELPPEFIENVPGSQKITEKLFKLKTSLDIGEGIVVDSFSLSSIPGVQNELQAVKMFLLPFTNPVNAISTIFAKQVEDLNKILKDFIKPEKLAESVEKIIGVIVAIHSIFQKIISLLQMINMLIKVMNILIRVYLIIAKILKKLPIPARYTTVGNIAKVADKANDMEHHKAKEMLDFLKVLEKFIELVIVSIAGVRDEMLKMIVALEQLKQNFLACPYTKDNYLQNGIDSAIISATNTLNRLEEQIPQLKNIEPVGVSPLQGPERNKNGETADSKCHKMYNGFCIRIESEAVVDDDITVRRRYATIKGPDGTIRDETAPTYATKDSIIINEAQFIIDKYEEIASPDANPDKIEDADIAEMIGVNLQDAEVEEKEAMEGLNTLIGEIQAEKELQLNLEKKRKERERKRREKSQKGKSKVDGNNKPDPIKIKQVARFVNTLTVEDFYQMTVENNRAYRRTFWGIWRNKREGRELVKQLGGLDKARNLNLVNAINKNVYDKYNRRGILQRNTHGYLSKERRLDQKNLQSLIAYLLRIKKYTIAEVQAGLEQTALSKKFNFTAKKGNVTFKRIRY